MSDSDSKRPLDNRVWSSLTTRHAHLARGVPRALHRLRLVQTIRRERAPLPEGGTEICEGDVRRHRCDALAGSVDPGLFRRRTTELGTFVGIRERGRLLAMAGERTWIGDYREVSSVCTA